MSRLVDPTICPDCRALLDATATCTSCGLRLSGAPAGRLWALMVEADRLLEELRTAPARAPQAVVAGAPTGASAALPAYPAPATGRRTARRLPAASVSVVLLSLGAICLLVAAIVFVAVTWSVLGLTGRTLVLVGLTAAFALVSVVLTRRGLRGASETFWLVVAGMLTVDLLGARSAGLSGLDALSWRGTSALVSGALLALGLVVGLWAARQPVTRLYGAQGVAVLGALILSSTNAWFAVHEALATTVAIPLLTGSFLLLRGRTPVAAYGLGGVGLLSWAVLLLIGWDRAESTTLHAWWAGGGVWPLLVTAVLAAIVVPAPRVPEAVRPVAAGLALVPLVVAVDVPGADADPSRAVLTVSLTLVVLGLVAGFAPRAWALGAAALSGVGVLGLGLMLTLAPWAVLERLQPDGRSPVDAVLTSLDGEPAAWTAGVAALAVVAAMAALLRVVPEEQRHRAVAVLGGVAPAVVALGGLVVVLRQDPPLWAGALAAGLAAAVAGAATWWVRQTAPAGWLASGTTAYLTVLALDTSAANELLLAFTTSLLFLALAAARGRLEQAGSTVSSAVTGALAALSGGWALVTWGVWLDADDDARAVALAAYAALVGVLAAPASRRAVPRVTLELSAAVLALTATLSAADGHTAAMVLTIAGTAVCAIAVVNRDRDLLGWAGAATLGVATAFRVGLEVPAPELYTLPAAALLVAAGLWRLHADREASSISVLGSGLTLALLPSLLLTLEEPLSLRGALVAVAGVLVLAAGVQQRLAAPFVIGALTTGVLALRHLQPVAEAVPRWISLGGVGLVLLVVGVTWEARRRNLETAGRYLTALR